MITDHWNEILLCIFNTISFFFFFFFFSFANFDNSDYYKHIDCSNDYFSVLFSSSMCFYMFPSCCFPVPGAVGMMKIINVGSHHMQVLWTPPAEPNGKLLGYEVRATSSKSQFVSFATHIFDFNPFNAEANFV